MKAVPASLVLALPALTDSQLLLAGDSLGSECGIDLYLLDSGRSRVLPIRPCKAKYVPRHAVDPVRELHENRPLEHGGIFSARLESSCQLNSPNRELTHYARAT